MKKGKFFEIGRRCREAREHIDFTMDQMKDETGLTRTSLSNYERGKLMPSSKYLQYLSSTHNVSIDYIFSGQGRVVKVAGKYTDNEEVNELIESMQSMPPVYHIILGFFEKYKFLNPKMFRKHQATNKPGGKNPAFSTFPGANSP